MEAQFFSEGMEFIVEANSYAVEIPIVQKLLAVALVWIFVCFVYFEYFAYYWRSVIPIV